MKNKDYITNLADGRIMVNSRFIFNNKKEAVDFFPDLKGVKIWK